MEAGDCHSLKSMIQVTPIPNVKKIKSTPKIPLFESKSTLAEEAKRIGAYKKAPEQGAVQKKLSLDSIKRGMRYKKL